MYEFVDTNKAGSKSSLPSEALQIDGTYIENLIDGYRTLYVTGRELLGSEISEREIDLVDGSEYTGKRDTTRSITVGYQLLCTSPREFQEKFNKLSGILNKEQAKLIFADEPDKYFIGTKSSVGDVEPGRMNVKGEFTFYCCDPCKYSSAEKQFPGVQQDGYQTITIQNNGTEWADVDYEITHKHENGYIGLVSQYGVIQLGKTEEADGEDYQQSETLFSVADGQFTAPQLAAFPKGIATCLPLNCSQEGTLASKIEHGENVVYLADRGGGGGIWKGQSITKRFSDSEGNETAKNFFLYIRHAMNLGKPQQVGTTQFMVTTRDKKNIAGIEFHKNNLSDYCDVRLYVNGEMKDSFHISVNATGNMNAYAGWESGRNSITKSGRNIIFYVDGKERPFSVPEVENMEAYEASAYICSLDGFEPITTQCIRGFGFRKDNVDKHADIPNRYRAGDVVRINGESTNVYINDMIARGDEITGTDYFKVPPGTTEVQFCYSSFSSPPPTVKAKIREVYL